MTILWRKKVVALTRLWSTILEQELTAKTSVVPRCKGRAVDVAQANLTLGNARDELINAQRDEKTG